MNDRNSRRLQIFDVPEGPLVTFPREIATFVCERAQQEGPKQYAHLDYTVTQVEGVYVLYATYDDVRIFWSGPFKLQAKDNYVFFHPQDERAREEEGTVWILCDTTDDVSIGMGVNEAEERVRLNGLVQEDQQMIFVCQLRVARLVKG